MYEIHIKSLKKINFFHEKMMIKNRVSKRNKHVFERFKTLKKIDFLHEKYHIIYFI